MAEKYDHLVIGGGVYGASVATSIAETFPRDSVLLVEREPELFKRASTNNHGRLHWGYQYPLHPETAIQSKTNVTNFVRDYGDCVNSDVASYYAVHKDSRITPGQYEEFCKNTGLACEREVLSDVFGPDVAAVYRTEELTFSNASLQHFFSERIKNDGVIIKTNCQIDTISANEDQLKVVTADEEVIEARNVFNCTYSGINEIHDRSEIPLIPSAHEKYALFKITLPEEIRNLSATVIYGAFASIVSNNEVGSHVLAHVKHSNCAAAINVASSMIEDEQEKLLDRYRATVEASARFLPILQEGKYEGEFVEVKSVFGTDPTEGERRVQTFPDYGGVENYHVIFGGKMNSFYDASTFALSVLDRRVRRGRQVA